MNLQNHKNVVVHDSCTTDVTAVQWTINRLSSLAKTNIASLYITDSYYA